MTKTGIALVLLCVATIANFVHQIGIETLVYAQGNLIESQQKFDAALDGWATVHHDQMHADHQLLMKIADIVAPKTGAAPATFDGYSIEACPGGKDCPR
jgi:hypothetical protein